MTNEGQIRTFCQIAKYIRFSQNKSINKIPLIKAVSIFYLQFKLNRKVARHKINMWNICCHIPGAILNSTLDLIGPEDTQLFDFKITQPPKLGS